MSSFKEKFGLDYLKPAQEQSNSLPPDVESLVVGYSRPLLEALNGSPEQSSKLFDLASHLGVRIDQMIPLVKFLTEKAYVRRVEVDSLGNDTIALTRDGQRLVSP